MVVSWEGHQALMLKTKGRGGRRGHGRNRLSNKL